jgi:hypothetical protein
VYGRCDVCGMVGHTVGFCAFGLLGAIISIRKAGGFCQRSRLSPVRELITLTYQKRPNVINKDELPKPLNPALGLSLCYHQYFYVSVIYSEQSHFHLNLSMQQ